MPLGSNEPFRRSGSRAAAASAARTRRPTCRACERVAWPPAAAAASVPAARQAVASQRWAPCHSTSSSPARPSTGAVCGSDRRHRVASWSIASSAATKNGSVWSRRPCQKAAPRRPGRLAAEPRHAFATAAARAAQAHDQAAVHHALASSGSGRRAPAVQLGERFPRLAVEAQRRLGRRAGSTLSETSTMTPRMPSDPATGANVVAGDVLDDAPAELQQLAAAVHDRHAEQWSRSDPAAARDGPERPAATMPPTVPRLRSAAARTRGTGRARRAAFRGRPGACPRAR